jgi:hypothetical protein
MLEGFDALCGLIFWLIIAYLGLLILVAIIRMFIGVTDDSDDRF